MLLSLVAKAIGGALGLVNLDQHVTTSTSTSTGTTIAGFRFKLNGTLVRLNGVDGASVSETQIDADTDWIIPNEAAAFRTFHVKAEETAQTGGGTLSGALSSWIEINGDEDWTITRINAAGNGTSVWDLTFQISDDGGSTVLDSSAGPHKANAVRNV